MLINAFVVRNQVETRGPMALKCSHDTCTGAGINLNDFLHANRNVFTVYGRGGMNQTFSFPY